MGNLGIPIEPAELRPQYADRRRNTLTGALNTLTGALNTLTGAT
jgi:hypothetical protein